MPYGDQAFPQYRLPEKTRRADQQAPAASSRPSGATLPTPVKLESVERMKVGRMPDAPRPSRQTSSEQFKLPVIERPKLGRQEVPAVQPKQFTPVAPIELKGALPTGYDRIIQQFARGDMTQQVNLMGTGFGFSTDSLSPISARNKGVRVIRLFTAGEALSRGDAVYVEDSSVTDVDLLTTTTSNYLYHNLGLTTTAAFSGAFDDFDSYSAGDLNTQNGGSGWSGAWSAPTDWDVQTSTVFEGANAVSCAVANDASGPQRDLSSALTTGLFHVAGRVSVAIAPGSTFRFHIQNSTNGTKWYVEFTSAGNIDLVGTTTVTIGTYVANTWYEIDVEFDTSGGTARGRINGGSWTSTVSASVAGSVDRVAVRFFVPADGRTVYFDDLTVAKVDTALRVAQSIISSSSLVVKKVKVYLAKVGSPSDNLRVSIQADSSGSPSGTIIISGTVAGSSLTTSPAQYALTLSAETSIRANDKMWVVVDRDGATSDTNYYQVFGAFGDRYADVAVKMQESGGTWDSEEACDLSVVLVMAPVEGRLYKTSAAAAATANAFVGFVTKDVKALEQARIQTDGVYDAFTGLSPGATYYLSDTRGAIQSSAGTVSRKVGIAPSATELYIANII